MPLEANAQFNQFVQFAERPYETVRQVLDPDFRFASDNDAVTCRTGYKITIA